MEARFMPAIAAERDLLFGLLALQNGLINQGQLVAAFQAWTCDKGRGLADHLVDRGDLDGDDRSALDALVSRHLKKHGDNMERSLAAIPASRSTRESLGRALGPAVEATLTQVGLHSTESGEVDRTVTNVAGASDALGRRFRVLRPHARGGLGAVFVALDEELHREVTLKQVLDEHVDHPVIRQRFLLEAEITGNLEHPGIVPVYSLGTYSDGRPYYAMRFIRGDALKKAIARFHADESLKSDPAQRSLELHKLLRRFLDVCNAIDYAHSRGVLHRDIKPANVVVGRHGETLVVDWGLAKALGAPPGSGGHDAEAERPLAPSASGSAETLPGSTIGTPSFMSPEQASGELHRLGPRSDIYSLGATLYALLVGEPAFDGPVEEVLRNVQHGEFLAPSKREPSIEKALESICLKAMALRPEDRYESPRELADDVERWMADEPVSVYLEPLVVRLGRWARRHKTPVAAVAAILGATLVALAIGNLLLGEANRRTEQQRVLAVANAGEARQQRKAAEENLKTAEENYGLAREAVNRFLTQVSNDRLLNEPHMADLRRELLGHALEFYQTFVNRRRDDPNARYDLGVAQHRLGEVKWSMGLAREAIAEFEAGRATLEQSVRDNPQGVKERSSLTRTLTTLGWRYQETGQIDAGERTLREAVRVAEALEREQPEDPARRMDLASALNQLGQTYARSRRLEDAERVERQAIALLEPLARNESPDNTYATILSAGYTSLGMLAYSRLDNTASLDWHRKALELRSAMVKRTGKAVDPRHALANAWNNVASVNRRLGQQDEAIRNTLKSIEILRELVRDHPTLTTIQSDLATILSNLSVIYRTSSRNADAHDINREAIAVQERLVAEHPERILFREHLGAAQGNEGNVWLDQRSFAEALGWYDRSIATLLEVLKREPRSTLARSVLRNDYWGRADALVGMSRPAEAIPAFDKAIELTDEKSRPEVRLCRAVALARSGDHAKATEVVDAETAVEPQDSTIWFESARVLAQSAVANSRDSTQSAGRRQDLSERLDRRAVEMLGRAAASSYFKSAQARDRLRRDPDLDPLRTRLDFQALCMDLFMPINPFAPGG
jgi:serine/threonine-protein kinase